MNSVIISRTASVFDGKKLPEEATIVGYGPDENNKYITTYFRKAFTVTSASSFTGLELKLLRDDGAVVYLNGTEVFRSNMPSETISYTTTALSDISDAREDSIYTTPVNPSLLVEGLNVVSVEIHQSDPENEDMSFDLSLNGTRPALISVVPSTNMDQYGLKVFPNPTSGTANIIYKGKIHGELKFRLTNMIGQVMEEETHPEFTGEWTKTIDFSGKAKGVYLLEIVNGKESITEKLVLN